MKYDCNEWNCIFTIQNNLIAYIKLESEEVKYWYNQCDSLYSHQGYVTTHVMLVYEGMKLLFISWWKVNIKALYIIPIWNPW